MKRLRTFLFGRTIRVGTVVDGVTMTSTIRGVRQKKYGCHEWWSQSPGGRVRRQRCTFLEIRGLFGRILFECPLGQVTDMIEHA
jgi:hypothetical protein